MNRRLVGAALIFFTVSIFISLLAGAAAYSAGLYDRRIQTLYVGWDAAIRVGGGVLIASLCMGVISLIIITIIDWMDKR